MLRAGKEFEMAFLRVDDRDGRVVAEIETEEDAQHVLEGWAHDDGSIPDYLCLVASICSGVSLTSAKNSSPCI